MSTINKIQLPNGEIYDVGETVDVDALTSAEIDQLTGITSSELESGIVLSSISVTGDLNTTGNVDVSSALAVAGAANLYGGIGSFGSNCGLLAVEQGATIPANSQSLSITADVPNGYTFLCWVNVSSHGWVGPVYFTHAHTAGTAIWANSTSTSARQLLTCFLCYKSSMPS